MARKHFRNEAETEEPEFLEDEIPEDYDPVTLPVAEVLPAPEPAPDTDVSVLLPIHNGFAHYPDGMLQRSISSILDDQSSVNVELCICDDGSTDETLHFVSGTQDRRVKVVQSDYMGVAEALNYCAQMATGRYMFQYSARAYLEPDSLRHLVKALDAKKKLGFACAQMKVYGNITRLHVPPKFDRRLYIQDYVANFYMCRTDSWHKHGCRYVDYVTLPNGWKTGVVDRDYLMQILCGLGQDGIALQDVPFVHYYYGGEHQGSAILNANKRTVDLAFRERWGKYL